MSCIEKVPLSCFNNIRDNDENRACALSVKKVTTIAGILQYRSSCVRAVRQVAIGISQWILLVYPNGYANLYECTIRSVASWSSCFIVTSICVYHSVMVFIETSQRLCDVCSTSTYLIIDSAATTTQPIRNIKVAIICRECILNCKDMRCSYIYELFQYN